MLYYHQVAIAAERARVGDNPAFYGVDRGVNSLFDNYGAGALWLAKRLAAGGPGGRRWSCTGERHP